MLSRVYRRHGADALEAALLNAADAPWWRNRMTADLAKLQDPLARIRDWTFFLGVGNWGTISVTEQDDGFLIHHQVCGSCGRQELPGCYDPPDGLGRVAEPLPGVNFGNPGYAIYRTHLAVWHFVMPIREVGHPWPAINCSGVPGRCWFTIYKEPMDTPSSSYGQVGLVKRA